MVEVMKRTATSFKRFHALPAALSAPALQQATADPCLCWKFLHTHGKVWVSLLWGHCSFLIGPGAHKVLFVPPPTVCFPSLCKFWQLYGGVNGDLLQEGLCHTQVCCTQSPWPCGRPLLTHASARDSWTLMGKSVSVSCGVTAPFSWVLVHTRFCLCLP